MTLNAGDGAVLGALFEPELIQRIGNAFNAGGGAHFIDQGLPQPIADYLNARWQEGYRVMVTQIRTDISAYNLGYNEPVPDMLFFKVDEVSGDLDYNNVIYFDSKIDGRSNLEDAQAALNSLAGGDEPFEISITPVNPNNPNNNPSILYKPAEFNNITLTNFQNRIATLDRTFVIGPSFEPNYTSKLILNSQ